MLCRSLLLVDKLVLRKAPNGTTTSLRFGVYVAMSGVSQVNVHTYTVHVHTCTHAYTYMYIQCIMQTDMCMRILHPHTHCTTYMYTGIPPPHTHTRTHTQADETFLSFPVSDLHIPAPAGGQSTDA